MTSTSVGSGVSWSERTVEVCGAPVRLAVAGAGRPIVVIPGDQGHPPATPFLDQLTTLGTVYYPWLPGFDGGDPENWEWLTNVHDLATVLRQTIDALALDRPVLAGLGFGGYLAAEIATVASSSLSALILVSPMGVKPEHGYYYDQFLVSTEHYAQTAFHDIRTFRQIYGDETSIEQLEAWETDREMTSRLAWKPYMYNTALSRLLSGVAIPALVVRGDDDQIIPAECAEIYRASLPNATLEVVTDSGHAVEMEQPGALLRSVSSFLSTSVAQGN
jgi:pimeloyl-ACP methyl ester carboxylesterase